MPSPPFPIWFKMSNSDNIKLVFGSSSFLNELKSFRDKELLLNLEFKKELDK